MSDPLRPDGLSPPGSSVHEILQAGILEWVAISFSRGSSQPRDQTYVSCTAGKFCTIWTNREAHLAMATVYQDETGIGGPRSDQIPNSSVPY